MEEVICLYHLMETQGQDVDITKQALVLIIKNLKFQAIKA